MGIQPTHLAISETTLTLDPRTEDERLSAMEWQIANDCAGSRDRPAFGKCDIGLSMRPEFETAYRRGTPSRGSVAPKAYSSPQLVKLDERDFRRNTLLAFLSHCGMLPAYDSTRAEDLRSGWRPGHLRSRSRRRAMGMQRLRARLQARPRGGGVDDAAKLVGWRARRLALMAAPGRRNRLRHVRRS